MKICIEIYESDILCLEKNKGHFFVIMIDGSFIRIASNDMQDLAIIAS